ncbi:MAG: hypothetical protein ABH839_04185 [Chloroflexota bacterium]
MARLRGTEGYFIPGEMVVRLTFYGGVEEIGGNRLLLEGTNVG